MEASAKDFLPRIKAPVLGLYPTSGSITSPEEEEQLAAGIKNLRMIHLPTEFHAILDWVAMLGSGPTALTTRAPKWTSRRPRKFAG